MINHINRTESGQKDIVCYAKMKKSINYVSIGLIALLMSICIIVVAIGNSNAQAATTKMTRLDFIRKTVEMLKNQTSYSESIFEGKKLTVKKENSGKVRVAGKCISARKVKEYQDRFMVSMEDAQVIGTAIAMGIMKKTTFTSVSKKIKCSEAAIILAKAHELIFGPDYRPDTEREIDGEDIDLVINERISDIGKIKKETNRIWFAKAYLYGFLKGSSEGEYSHTRKMKPGAYLSKKNLDAMLESFFDFDERVKLSYDWQVCRDSKLPETEELYAYVLDTFPNAYYDTGFNGKRTADFFTEGLGSGELKERMLNHNFSFVRPSEIEEFSALDFDTDRERFHYEGREFWNENRNITIPLRLVSSAEEYFKYALNVDYRTIDDDINWRTVMGQYLSDDELKNYIAYCKKNKTIIECDKVAADLSGVYWYDGEYQCKVYVHLRIVSDETLSKGIDDDENYGTLFPVRYGLEPGDRYTRLIFGEQYMKYQIGEWTDYYFNVSGTNEEDAYGCLNTSMTTQGIMVDYGGDYPWLLSFPYRIAG